MNKFEIEFQLADKEWKPLSIAAFYYNVETVYSPEILSLYSGELLEKEVAFEAQEINTIPKSEDIIEFLYNKLEQLFKNNKIELSKIENYKFSINRSAGEIYIGDSSEMDNSKYYYNVFNYSETRDNENELYYKDERGVIDFIKTSDNIIDYIKEYALIYLSRRIDAALLSKSCQIYARMGELFTKNFILIPPNIWKLCEVLSWQEGVAISPEGIKLYDIHIASSEKRILDFTNPNPKRPKPQTETAIGVLKTLYPDIHPRQKNPILTDARISELVNSHLLKYEPSAKRISRMTVVEAMKELWGKK